MAANFLLLEAGGWGAGYSVCDCVGRPGAAPERLTLCLRGREPRGGRHGGVGEPAQENGVQGEAATRSPPGAHPPHPSAPGWAWRDPAQRASRAVWKLQSHPPELLRPPAQRSLSPCPGTPIRRQGRWGAVTVNKGEERRPPATCRPPSLRVEFGAVREAV